MFPIFKFANKRSNKAKLPHINYFWPKNIILINPFLNLNLQPNKLFPVLLTPKSKDQDQARREYILNILLIGSIVLAFLANLSATIGMLNATEIQRQNYLPTYLQNVVILIFFVSGYILSRIGHAKIVSHLMILTYLCVTFYASYRWGADFSQGIAIYSLVIVMAGILINSKFAFIVTIIIAGVLSILIYYQNSGILPVNSSWREESANMRDAFITGTIFFITALVSWLFNKEGEKALIRARQSESALKRQKNQLKILVEKRTYQLKQAQAEKISQLYRFAEFGRAASGLFHDLANPLTLVSLNLTRLYKNSKIDKSDVVDTKTALERAIVGTKKLESFILAARRQIQNQEISKRFSTIAEINHALQIVNHRAKKSNVNILLVYKSDIRIFGNPIKFNQVITNLVSNAIDAYHKIRKKQKNVEIKLEKQKNKLVLTVQDWASGIATKNVSRVFEPLFTTKGLEKGTGIGLSICKDIVEKDFKGKIQVNSKIGQGSIFIVEIPIK